MATLTDAASFSKKTFFWFGVFFVSIVILVIIFFIGQSLIHSLIPSKPFPATVAFGKLPRLDLSEGNKPPSGINYSIETITGDLPVLADSAKVFEVGQAESSFGDLERTKMKAASVGFSDPPVNISGNLVKFSDQKDNSRILTLDTLSNNLTLESNYLNDMNTISGKAGTKNGAISLAEGFVENFDINKTNFPEEKIVTDFLRIDAGNLIEVPALSEANLIKVNFSRADLDSLPVISPNAEKPGVWVLASEKTIVAAKVAILNIQKHKFATYPLKTTKKAFEDLKSGNGAFNKPFLDKQFPVRDVILGYLETESSQNFLMPVYIFKSDNDLVAYVSAVDNLWVK